MKPQQLSIAFNCAFARVAIRELTPAKRGCKAHAINKDKRAHEFKKLFDIPTFKLDDHYFSDHSRHTSLFNEHCETILSGFSKPWHPVPSRMKYIQTFSTIITTINTVPNLPSQHDLPEEQAASYKLHMLKKLLR